MNLNDLLFSPPWWLPTVIAIAGVVLFVTGNSGQKSKVRNAGLGVVLLAILYVVVAYAVDTDKERVTKQSKDVVAAVEKRDWARLTELLDSTCVLSANGGTMYDDRKSLVDGARANVDRWAVKSINITGMDVKQDPGGIVADLVVLTQGDYPTTSGWQFTWQKVGDAWKLHQIDCTRIGNDKVSEISKFIGK